MKYKADWDEARERLTDLWEGRDLDRPCISVLAPSGKAVKAPPAAKTPEAFWLDPAIVVARSRNEIESLWWGGESIPSALLMCGWVVCLGGEPRFESSTIWFEHKEFDLGNKPNLTFDPDSPWCRKYETCLRAMAEAAGNDDFMVGSSGGLPANDLFSMQMGTEKFLMNLMDHPEWMQAAIVQGGEAQAKAAHYYASITRQKHDFWYGCAGWMPFWAPKPFHPTQSDVSCMLSPEMYVEFVKPELDICAGEHGAVWYHLDGSDARQHLPTLLSLPYLRVVQYTPTPSEPPNGPAHMEFYKQIQAAGRILHIQLPKEHVEPLVRSLDPRFMMLHTWCESIAEGQELLAAAKKWTAARRIRGH